MTYSAELKRVVDELSRTPRCTSEDQHVHVVYPAFERLAEAYVRDHLAGVCDVRFEADLIKPLLTKQPLTATVAAEMNDYVVRSHVRDLMCNYMASIHAARAIKIKNRNAFDREMAKLGFGGCKPRFQFAFRELAWPLFVVAVVYTAYCMACGVAALLGVGAGFAAAGALARPSDWY